MRSPSPVKVKIKYLIKPITGFFFLIPDIQSGREEACVLSRGINRYIGGFGICSEKGKLPLNKLEFSSTSPWKAGNAFMEFGNKKKMAVRSFISKSYLVADYLTGRAGFFGQTRK